MAGWGWAGTVAMGAALTIGCGPSVSLGTGGDTEGSSTSSEPDEQPDTNASQPDPDTSASSATASGDEGTGGSSPGTTTGSAGTTTSSGGDDDCTAPHDAPGCDQPEIEACVCEQQPNCCVFEWDESCAALAQAECAAVGTSSTGGSTGGSTSSTGEPGETCAEVVTFEMLPSEATLTGAWELGMSMVGEGEIAVLNQMLGTGGSVLFEPDIPCNDTWYIWVRYWEQGNDDSYFATLDGSPMPDAIFEGDCSAGGDGYAWAPLNWRDQNFGPCEYVEDPWAPGWDAGTHAIEFSYRESLALGRILVTNDPALVP